MKENMEKIIDRNQMQISKREKPERMRDKNENDKYV